MLFFLPCAHIADPYLLNALQIPFDFKIEVVCFDKIYVQHGLPKEHFLRHEEAELTLIFKFEGLIGVDQKHVEILQLHRLHLHHFLDGSLKHQLSFITREQCLIENAVNA